MKTYLIMRRGYAERRDWVGGFLGTVMAYSKQRAIKKAAKLYGMDVEAFFQPS